MGEIEIRGPEAARLTDFVTTNAVARLNDDGSLDATVNFGTGANGQVNAVGVQGDGRLVVAGAFTAFNGTAAGRIVRLDGGLNTDGGTFAFSAASYSAAESAGTVTVTVNRTGGLNNTVTVNYNVPAGAGNIASVSPGSLSFAPGQNSANLTVNLLADNTTVQSDRTVTLGLTTTSSGSVGTPTTTTVTIQDDDSVIGFAQTGYTVSEGGGTASIAVLRLGGVAGTVLVDYATVAEVGFGKATAGSDYTAVSGTLTFTNGATNLSFTITIAQDALNEGNETVTLALANARGQGGASASLATVNNQASGLSGMPAVGHCRRAASSASLKASSAAIPTTAIRELKPPPARSATASAWRWAWPTPTRYRRSIARSSPC